jgi:hypothetical protein
MNKKLNYIIAGILLISLIGILVGEVEDEISQLEQELIDSGYEWLINYSVNYPKIEIYEQNGEDIIAEFEDVSDEDWYQIFPEEILIKKLRIEEIKIEINKNG